MKKLALIVALMFGATGVVLAADAPAGGKTEATKTDPKKKVDRKDAKKAEATKMDAPAK